MTGESALLAALMLFQLLAHGGHQGLTEIFYKLPDTGQPPILLSLGDAIKLELGEATENHSFLNHSQLFNNTETLTNKVEDKVEDLSTKNETTDESKLENTVQETLVVKARPIQELKLTDEAFMPSTPPPIKIEEIDVNKTETEDIPSKIEQPQEDIPSFSEWAQKQLEEAEKQDTVLNFSSQLSQSTNNNNGKNAKLRSKNYASPACGAKIVAVNAEAGSASSILSQNKDEYMLNTCNSRIWFIVELCEAIQAQKIELANFELFSSSPKEFNVFVSDRFPTRDWTSVGQFTAKNDKEIQSFDLFPHLFGKFIKVEMLSHYGSEHYCPISLFKAYGTSEFEVLEKENSQHPNAQVDDDDDDEILGDLPDAPVSDVELSKNLFGSARDAVMSIMKKAAQVLVKSDSPKNKTDESKKNNTNCYNKCNTPSHIIVCDNCSEILFNEVYDLISCSSNSLMNIINNKFIEETIRNTEICRPFGLDFRNKRTVSFRNEQALYMSAILSKTYIAALCNFIAIIDKKVVLNTSYETELNTSNLTLDKVSNTVVNENNLNEIVQIPFKDGSSDKDLGPKPVTKVPIVSNVSELEEAEKSKEIPDKELTEKAIEEPYVKDSQNINHDKEGKETEHVKIDKVITEKTNEITETTTITPTSNVTVEETKIEQISEASELPTQEQAQQITSDKNQNGNVPTSASSPDELSDPLVMETENFLSEFDNLISDPTVQTTVSPNVPNNPGPPQKESVFLRLSNRVKTLERNMSLSGQYLEELSRRYKKQVEEMQKSFEKTLLQIGEDRKKTEERDQQNSEQLAKLQTQLAEINEAMQQILEERAGWFGTMTFFKFILFQGILIAIVFYYIKKKQVVEPQPIQTSGKLSRSRKNERRRRKSVEGVSGHRTPAGKKRRPSEEALEIARQSTEHLHHDDDDDGEWQVARKNRRRKTSIVHRSLNGEQPIWIRQDSIGVLQENVIPLDEAEFIAPVPEPVQFAAIAPAPSKEFPKTNGSIMSSLKVAKVKSRRLSSPAFFRSALGRQSTRSAATTNGDVSPRSSLGSESPAPRENGSCASDLNTLKTPKRRSFKNLFKKVF